MKTVFEKIFPQDADIYNPTIKRAADIIKRGGLVVFPTETVYGLGADGCDEKAAEKIYTAKGRPQDNPLIIHIADPRDAEKYAVTNDCYYRLAKAFMPGPLTVILPKKDTIPSTVTGGLDSVAVRCPSHPVAHALIAAAGVPIAAPSANLSGKPSPTCASHVADDMNGRVDMIIDGGTSEIGLESTIIKLNGDENSNALLLRPGAITADALSCVCHNVIITDAALAASHAGDNERPLSPGMKYKHYAPDTPLVLLDGNPSDVFDFLKTELSHGAFALCYDEEAAQLPEGRYIKVGQSDDLAAHGRLLFSSLREADKTGSTVIYAHLPPQDGFGLALYNRMLRAAAHTVKRIQRLTN